MNTSATLSRRVILWLCAFGCIAQGCAGTSSDVRNKPAGVRRVPLLGERMFPEGIAAHRISAEIFVGGVAQGEIQHVTARGASPFKRAHADGLHNVIGLAVDSARDRLWVCSTTFDDPFGPAALVVFDIPSGRALASLPLPADGAPHFLNDVDVDSTGAAYATDSLSPLIWTVPADLSHIEVLVRDPLWLLDPNGFNLNGLVVTPCDRFLIASLPSLSDSGHGKLFRVELATRRVIEIEQDPPFAGADGLTVLSERRVIASGAAPGLFLLDFDAGYGVVQVTPLERFAGEFAQPTTSAIADGRLWVVNSQLDHYVVAVFGDKGPPALPFELVGIPVSEL